MRLDPADLGVATEVRCPHCSGSKCYSRIFVGRHIDSETGEEVPLDYLHLPTEILSKEAADYNARSLKCYQAHMRTVHFVKYKPKYAGFSQASIVPLRRKRVAAKPKIGKAAASAQVASVQTSALMDHSGVATETPPDASPATNQPVASTTVRDSEVDLAGAGQTDNTSPCKPVSQAEAASTGDVPAGAGPAAPGMAGPAVCRQPTLIVCQECVRAGCKKPFSKPFYGRRINLVTGEEEPMDYLHWPNDSASMSEVECIENANSLRAYKYHVAKVHPGVPFKPRYAGFTYWGKASLKKISVLLSEEQRLAIAKQRQELEQTDDATNQEDQEADASSLGAGAYMREALVQAEDQLRGLDLHPVHPPAGSGMRTQKAQVLSEMLQRTGLLDELDISNVHSRWLWDTDEWEPAWMSEETLKRVDFDVSSHVYLRANKDVLIGREWRALKKAWRAAERRYASVLEALQQGRQVLDMNGCYEIQNLRMLVKSLNAYVTVCAKEASTAEAGRSATQPKTTPASSSPVARITSAAAQLTNEPQADAVPAPPASTKARLTRAAAQATKPESDVCDEPWVQLWEDRVWEVATELAEDMYEQSLMETARMAPALSDPDDPSQAANGTPATPAHPRSALTNAEADELSVTESVKRRKLNGALAAPNSEA